MVNNRAPLRNRLKARAYEALALAESTVQGTIQVCARDRQNEVRLLLSPRGGGEQPASHSGRWLSDLETAVVLLLQNGARMQVKQIASRLNRNNDVVLRTILSNLKDREILSHTHGEGYFLVQKTP